MAKEMELPIITPALTGGMSAEVQAEFAALLRLQRGQLEREIREKQEREQNDLATKKMIAQDTLKKMREDKQTQERCSHRSTELDNHPTTVVFVNYNGLMMVQCARCKKSLVNISKDEAMVEFKGALRSEESWGQVFSGPTMGLMGGL